MGAIDDAKRKLQELEKRLKESTDLAAEYEEVLKKPVPDEVKIQIYDSIKASVVKYMEDVGTDDEREDDDPHYFYEFLMHVFLGKNWVKYKEAFRFLRRENEE